MHRFAILALAVTGIAAACAEVPEPQELKVLSVQGATPLGKTAAAGSGGDATLKGRDVVLLEQAHGQVAWLQALLEDVKARAARGELSDTDVAQVESRLAAAKARRAALRGNLAVSCARYQELVGQPAPSCVD